MKGYKKIIDLFFLVLLFLILFTCIQSSALCGNGKCEGDESWYDENEKIKCEKDCLMPPEMCCIYKCEDLSTEDVRYFCWNSTNPLKVDNADGNYMTTACFCRSGHWYDWHYRVVCTLLNGTDDCENIDESVCHEGEKLICNYDPLRDYNIIEYPWVKCPKGYECRYEATPTYYYKMWKYQIFLEEIELNRECYAECCNEICSDYIDDSSSYEECFNTKCDEECKNKCGELYPEPLSPNITLINMDAKCIYKGDIKVQGGVCSQNTNNCNETPRWNGGYYGYSDPTSPYGGFPDIVFSNCYCPIRANILLFRDRYKFQKIHKGKVIGEGGEEFIKKRIWNKKNGKMIYYYEPKIEILEKKEVVAPNEYINCTAEVEVDPRECGIYKMEAFMWTPFDSHKANCYPFSKEKRKWICSSLFRVPTYMRGKNFSCKVELTGTTHKGKIFLGNYSSNDIVIARYLYIFIPIYYGAHPGEKAQFFYRQWNYFEEISEIDSDVKYMGKAFLLSPYYCKLKFSLKSIFLPHAYLSQFQHCALRYVDNINIPFSPGDGDKIILIFSTYDFEKNLHQPKYSTGFTFMNYPFIFLSEDASDSVFSHEMGHAHSSLCDEYFPSLYFSQDKEQGGCPNSIPPCCIKKNGKCFPTLELESGKKEKVCIGMPYLEYNKKNPDNNPQGIWYSIMGAKSDKIGPHVFPPPLESKSLRIYPQEATCPLRNCK